MEPIRPRFRSSHQIQVPASATYAGVAGRLTFATWAISDHKSVADARGFEIQIPSDVFLAGLFISPHALFAKFVD